MTSLKYILERLLHTLPVLLGVTVFVFFAIQLVPGDPIRIMMHGRVSDQEVQAIYERLGMNRPLLIQYVDFLRRAVQGDLGNSTIQNAPVTAVILEKVWPSVWLLVSGAMISILLALPLALMSAFYRNRWADHMMRVASMVGF